VPFFFEKSPEYFLDASKGGSFFRPCLIVVTHISTEKILNLRVVIQPLAVIKCLVVSRVLMPLVVISLRRVNLLWGEIASKR
jgi:hypothetical protein